MSINPYAICRPKGIDWDSQPLGKFSDAEIAKRVGVAKKTVTGARRRRGIPGFIPPSQPLKPKLPKPSVEEIQREFWDSQPLGKMSDVDLAKLTGYCKATVTNQRTRRGIPRYRVIDFIDWDAQGLGTQTDLEISKRLGISYHHVATARKERGIPAVWGGPPLKEERINWDNVALGSMPDKDLAALIGVHWTNIYEQRKKRGISRFRPRTTCPCGKPTIEGFLWCSKPSQGKAHLASCAYKVTCARKWCGIYRPRGGSSASRNHALDRLFLVLYELESTIRRKLGVKKTNHG